MPCAAIGVLVAAEDVGERAMSAWRCAKRRVAVQRRADQRMAKLDVAVEGAHEARRLGWLERIGLDAERGGRVEQGRQTAGVVGRDEQQQHLRRRRQRASTLEIDALDLRALRKRLGQRRATGELLVAEQARELDQRERIPTGVLHEPILHLGRERSGGALGQQCSGRVGVAGSLRRSSASPGASKRRSSPSRAAKSSTTPSASRRRAANVSASADGRSSHWASSTTHTSGTSSAASASRLSIADADEEAVLDRHPR